MPPSFLTHIEASLSTLLCGSAVNWPMPALPLNLDFHAFSLVDCCNLKKVAWRPRAAMLVDRRLHTHPARVLDRPPTGLRRQRKSDLGRMPLTPVRRWCCAVEECVLAGLRPFSTT